jgi:hypothetical protein
VRTTSVAWVFGASVLLLSMGMAAAGGSISAPQLVVGDHWQYRVTDNLRRGVQSQLDVEVLDVSGRTARIRSVRTDANGSSEWIDEVDGDGGLRSGSLNREPVRPFNPPVELFAFPLDKGKVWRQTIDTMRKDTGIKDQILIYGKVSGTAAITVPAGSFDTLYVYRTVQLDDSEFWRSRTTRRDSIWYASAAKAPVKEKREGEYQQRDRGMPTVRTESTLLELVSFRPGGK